MSAPKLAPCYKCDGKVAIYASHGGFGSGDLTAYRVKCNCGLVVDELGNDGTKRNAVRHWNRIAKALAALVS